MKVSALISVLMALLLPLTAIANLTSNDKKYTVRLTTAAPRQGQTVEVTLRKDDVASSEWPQLEFNHHIYKSFGQDATTAKTLIAIPVDLNPGTYQLKLLPAQNAGKEDASQQVPVKVVPGKFVLQRLSLSKKAAELTPNLGEEEAVDKAKAALSPARFWQGPFSLPVKARISTTFGAQRIVNGKKLSDYYHSGIDYAANMGQPVAACANGKVILVGRNFSLHGNIVAIDHGQGVVSFYLHLQKILVKDGQEVKQGEIIGKVGETGRANGPHLHFSLYVNQVSANPNDWYKQFF